MKITVHNLKLQTVFVCSLLQNEDIQCYLHFGNFSVTCIYCKDTGSS